MSEGRAVLITANQTHFAQPAAAMVKTHFFLTATAGIIETDLGIDGPTMYPNQINFKSHRVGSFQFYPLATIDCNQNHH